MIDCDVHNVVGPITTLEPYLDDHWREVIATSQFRGPTDQSHAPNLATSLRRDLDPVDGFAPGRTLASVRSQLLDPLALRARRSSAATTESRASAIRTLPPRSRPPSMTGRSRSGSSRSRACGRPIVVPSQQPSSRPPRSSGSPATRGSCRSTCPYGRPLPYGNRIWWPLLAAAAEHGLVVELHFGGSPGLPPTAAGWPSSWLEEYVDMASAFQSQLTSLVAEGVFDRFPSLRVALIESGFAWLPAFLWRFDKGWRGLRREIPWTRSAAIRVRPRPCPGRRSSRSTARPGGRHAAA